MSSDWGLTCIFVSLGCGWVVNNRNLFLIVTEWEMNKIKLPGDLLSGKGPRPGGRMMTSCVPHDGKRAGALSGSLS